MGPAVLSAGDAVQSQCRGSVRRFNGASGIKRWGPRTGKAVVEAVAIASMGPAVLSAGDPPVGGRRKGMEI